MEDKLISFETALLAKEKGFNEPIYYFYSIDDKVIYTYKSFLRVSDEEIKVEAPTQSLLQKWLRDTHGVHLWVVPIFCDEVLDRFEVYSNTVHCLAIPNRFSSYEEALEEGLLKVLKLIK